MKYSLKFLTVVLSLLSLVGCLSEDDRIVYVPPIKGDIISPEVGGPAQPNQVWIDLSAAESSRMKITNRTAWDLGFYGGDNFFVILNSSILMAAGVVDGAVNIDAVNESDVGGIKNILTQASGYSEIYVDAVTGNYLQDGTAIAPVSQDNSENYVYLLKLGYGIYEGNTFPGVAHSSGVFRGWKKIRILRSGEDYLLQYADVESTTHQEVVISKNADYNFTFYSIVNNQIADIEPLKQNWDICFTVMNNVIEGHGTYIYTDFVTSNNLGGVGVYEVVLDNTSDLIPTYNNFDLTNVDESLFVYNDQRVIGSNWRNVFDGVPEPNRFYVLKDPEGIIFKLRFIRLLGDSGEIQGYRGYPQFEYEPL